MFCQHKVSLKFKLADDLGTNYTEGKGPSVCEFWFSFTDRWTTFGK